MVSTRQMTITTAPSGSSNSGSNSGGSGNGGGGVDDSSVSFGDDSIAPMVSATAGLVGSGRSMALSMAVANNDSSNQLSRDIRFSSSRSSSSGQQYATTSSAFLASLSGVGNGRVERPAKQLLDLPVEILDHIFSYVGYRKVSQMRLVCQSMNAVCTSVLNSTFQKLQTQLLNRFQGMKKNMPRRESSRRMHPLSFECDIVETCYMRLSLVQMTFGKHIDRKHICFFPGAILDEVYTILNTIRVTPHTGRHHSITEELYDLSTMAMEYFKEHLEPKLPPIVNFNRFLDYNFSKTNTKSKYLFETPSPTTRKGSSSAATSSSHSSPAASSSPPQSNMVLRKGIRKIKQGMKRYNNQLTVLRNDLRFCKKKSTEQVKHITEMQKLLAEQQKQTLEFAARLDENDKKNEEMSMKISTLLQEANKCKTELQYWRSKSPTTSLTTSTNGIAPPPPPAYTTDDVDGSALMMFNSIDFNVVNPDEQTVGVGSSGIVLNVATANGIDLEMMQVQIENRQNDLNTTTTTTATSSSSSLPSSSSGTIVSSSQQQDVAGGSKCDGSSSVNVANDSSLNSVAGGSGAIVTIKPIVGQPNEIKPVENNEITSVICSVGLPAIKSMGKRKLDADWATTTSTTANGGGQILAGGTSTMICANGGNNNGGAAASGSDIKKARRVQNKARCQNVINGSSSNSNSYNISNNNSSNNSNIGSGKNTRSK